MSVSTRQDRFSSSSNDRTPEEVTSLSEGAKQSMHSSGSMTRIRSASWMQSTGQTSTQERSLMSMQGSAMMYVTRPTVDPGRERARRQPSGWGQLRHDLLEPLAERRLREHLVEAGGMCGTKAGRVGVVREADDRDVRVRVGDLLRLDARDVREDELRILRVVYRDQTMAGQQGLELPPHEQFDPTEQDRRHVGRLERDGGCIQARARSDSRKTLLRSARGAGGSMARGAGRGARFLRSEERRVGKECRARWSRCR